MIIFFALLLVDPLLLGSITGGGIAPPYVPNLSMQKTVRKTLTVRHARCRLCVTPRGVTEKKAQYMKK